MSRFLCGKHEGLKPYTPGEQIRQTGWIKLNTNESPFAPPDKVSQKVCEAAGELQLYCDPDATGFRKKLSEHISISPDRILVTNGSDEILHFAFMAYCDEDHPALFPDITYGFYKVFADLERVPCCIMDLGEDLRVDVEDYKAVSGTVFLANPNANTGIALSLSEIDDLLGSDPDRVVVIDEAYVEFGAESALDLVKKHDNLLVTRTFSKAWSMAGARLGYGVGSKDIIDDLNRIKYSTDPYNVNSMTQAAGIAVLEEADEISSRCRQIEETREWFCRELLRRGYEFTPSAANFVLARTDKMSGERIYNGLKEKKILVRHFGGTRIEDYVRITIGSREQMEKLLDALDDLQ